MVFLKRTFFLKKIFCFDKTIHFFFSRYHGSRMINYDSHRGVRVQNDRLGSTLTLSGASAADSGNYTCTPDSVRASSVSVHVVTEGEGEGAAGRAQEAVASDNNKGGGGKDKVGN